jgi:two-component system chemotaxis response regulator CheY
MLDPSTKVLVVDDVPLMRKLTCSFLNKMGITNVREVATATGALLELRLNRVDLVISDWNMPEMNGIELFHAMRKEETLKRIPLLLMTARDDTGDLAAALKAGVSDYISKPFDSRALEEKVRKVLHR